MSASLMVRNLSKCYHRSFRASPFRTFRETVGNWNRHTSESPELQKQRDPQWALRNVSFSMAPGEIMGVVGANGAGKSTLLRILAQITQPTEGKVVLGGRVASVLGVGPGFHPELTGRENLFLSGSILGMSRREILERVNDIASFAGVAQALESPVKQFSTGMRARLALSLACHIDPDILLVDETLAVGDLAFQQKCLQRIMEVGRKGGIIVLVTHDLNVVREYCNSALFFRGGQIVAGGDPAGVLSTYAKGG